MDSDGCGDTEISHRRIQKAVLLLDGFSFAYPLASGQKSDAGQKGFDISRPLCYDLHSGQGV